MNIPKCFTHTYSFNVTAALGNEGQMDQLYIKYAPSVNSGAMSSRKARSRERIGGSVVPRPKLEAWLFGIRDPGLVHIIYLLVEDFLNFETEKSPHIHNSWGDLKD